jgi:hypothetical protein
MDHHLAGDTYANPSPRAGTGRGPSITKPWISAPSLAAAIIAALAAALAAGQRLSEAQLGSGVGSCSGAGCEGGSGLGGPTDVDGLPRGHRNTTIGMTLAGVAPCPVTVAPAHSREPVVEGTPRTAEPSHRQDISPSHLGWHHMAHTLMSAGKRASTPINPPGDRRFCLARTDALWAFHSKGQ